MRVPKRVGYGLLATALVLAALLKPAVIFYPLGVLLGLCTTIVVFVVVFVGTHIHLSNQKLIDDTYRIPGSQIVLRTTFDHWAMGSAPYLEVGIGNGPPLKFCMAGPSLTRAQLYSVDGGRILLETSRDTFLIDPAPSSVKGPRSWVLQGGVFFNEYERDRCEYDTRSSVTERERIALKAGLKLVYLGAFVTGGDGYRRFLPASASPEQKIAP